MIKPVNSKNYNLYAAICYTAYALYNIIYRITYVNQNPDYASVTVWNVIFWIATISIIVTLVIKNHKAIIVAAGANALLNVFFLARYFSLTTAFDFLVDFLVYVGLVAILVFALSGNDIVKKFWFVPAALMWLSNLIFWIDVGYFSYLNLVWKQMLFNLMEVVGLLFIGMWAKENIAVTKVSTEETVPVNAYATFNPQAINAFSPSDAAIVGADELMKYKELLDAGILTKEEFDAQKKKILGL